MIVIDGCHVATVDAADTEYPAGHVMLDGPLLAGVGAGPAPDLPGAERIGLFFNHWWPNLHRKHGAVETAVEHGAVVPNTEATTREKAEATPKHSAE